MNTSTIDPLPPNDMEAEEAVLGSLLIDPSAIPPVAAFLKTEDFYLTTNGWIYQAALELGERCDLLTAARCLAERKQLEECGGDAYLAQLTASVPTALNVVAYAEIVKRKALSRRMAEAAQRILQAAYNPALEAEALVDSAQTAVIKAATDATARKAVSLNDAIDEYWNELDDMLESGIVPGIPTGISSFDYMVGGWKPNRLTVIGALPGHGKTTLMLNTLLHAAKKGHRSVMVSLEMKESELIESLVANESGVDVSPVALLKLSKPEQREAKGRVADALERIRQLPLHLIYLPSASPADVVYEVKRITARHGHVGLVAFDYIQLGRPNAVNKNANREQEVAYVALGLKVAAGELGAHLLTGSQVNENGETRESRAITQHADTVIYLKKDEETQQR